MYVVINVTCEIFELSPNGAGEILSSFKAVSAQVACGDGQIALGTLAVHITISRVRPTTLSALDRNAELDSTSGGLHIRLLMLFRRLQIRWDR